MSPCLVGDAVLYLKETPCQNIILFGSCGGVKSKGGLSVGSLVTPFKCYSNESFTQMLLGKDAERNIFYANQELFNSFLKVNKNSGLRKVTCSTISSLKLEEEMVDSFIRENIDVVDMECSAFFSASSSAGFKAIALFYVSDIIKIKPFYMNLDPVLKEKLSSSIKKASSLLCEFIKKNLNV
jgi:purine-nucleoside phosphorylase